MANLWMPLYVAEYLGDTGHLSTIQHGAYLLLIMHYWQKEAPLPDNNKTLAQITRLRAEHWARVRPELEGFFTIKLGKHWIHDRVDRELKKAADLREKKRLAGVASGNRRSTAVQQPFTQLQPQDTKVVNLNGFVVGKKPREETTIRDAGERLSRFQKTLAEAMGRDGYSIVGAAQDPGNPLYARSLALCQAKAEELGKGWPHQWPK